MSEVNIPSLLEARAARHGDRTAIIANDGTGTYRSISFAELLDYADRVGSALASLLGPARDGSDRRRVCWMYSNSNGLMSMVLYHAVLRMGGVNVPINPGSSPEDAEQLIALVDAAIVVSPPGVLLASDGPAERLEIADFAELAAFGASAERGIPRRDPARAEDPAAILFTSGTTGRSKGVVHSHLSSMEAGRGWSEAFELTDADVYQAMYPAYAGAGLHFSGLACLLAGAVYLVDETRPTADSLGRVDTYRTTVYAAVPSIFQYWLLEDRTAYDLGTLRLLDFGGAVMHRSAIERLREFVPGADLIQTYGLTEAGPGGLYLPPESLDRKLGSIGSRATHGLRFRVDTTVAAESEAEQSGEVGELQFAGTSIMLGYLDDPQGTAAVFDGEWLRTGDLVRIDDDGYVYFVDRLKDLIIRGGFNISSIEIEEALLRFPGVRDVAAFGYPHETLGEVVAIAVVMNDGVKLDLPEFRRFAQSSLARVKVPERIAVIPMMPLSAAGKVQKTALRTQADLVEWKEV